MTEPARTFCPGDGSWEITIESGSGAGAGVSADVGAVAVLADDGPLVAVAAAPDGWPGDALG